MPNSWVVSSEEEGMTLLSFLREKYVAAPSVKALKRAIDGKFVSVNGRTETFSSHSLKSGDKVSLNLAAFSEKKIIEPTILFEDDSLIIIDKPAGVVSEKIPGILVHRLDKETSGVLILAKSPAAKEKMVDLFVKHQVHKRYLALVDGIVGKDQSTIDNFLAPKSTYQGQTIYGVASKGQRAITHWKCLKRGDKASLILCSPQTGRTHQLRVHLSAMGHPILGDTQYGKHFKCPFHPQRVLLHAYSIAFEQIEVIAPLPEDFKEALKHVHMTFSV